MPQRDPLRDQIIGQFDAMSPQLQQAARYVLEHPNEVALVSMRELARHAQVTPATMTRLAKFLGKQGYDEIRDHYVAALRRGGEGFAAKVLQQDKAAADIEGGGIEGGNIGVGRIAEHMLQGLSRQVAQLCQPDSLQRLETIANTLISASNVYVLGLRSNHSVAWHFHYVMSLLGDRSIHLEGAAGTSGDALMRAQPEDVLLVVSVKPYAIATLELARLAKDKGLTIVSITDSEVSPLVALSEQSVYCPTESDSFFHTLTPALAISEVLCTLLAEDDRPRTLEALQRADEHFLSLSTYAASLPRRG